MATATKTASKLSPLGDRVVVKPSAREEMTKSGIVLPDTAKEKPQEGEILAVGPGRVLDDGKREAMDVKVGQKVLYGKYAGTDREDLALLGLLLRGVRDDDSSLDGLFLFDTTDDQPIVKRTNLHRASSPFNGAEKSVTFSV